MRERARQAAEERVLDLLLPPSPTSAPSSFGESSAEAEMAREHASAPVSGSASSCAPGGSTRSRWRSKCAIGRRRRSS